MRGWIEQVRRRVAVKLTLTLLGFVGVVMVVSGVFLDRRLEAIAIGNLTTQLTRQARLIEPGVRPVLGAALASESAQQLLHSFAGVTAARVTVIAENGSVLGDSERTLDGVLRMDNHLNRPEIQQALSTGIGEGRRRSDTTGVETLYVAVRSIDRRGYLRLGYPLDEVTRTTGEIRWAVIVGGLLAMAVALGIGLFVSGRLTRPVIEMERVAHRMTEGDFSLRAPTRSVDEVGRLARALNMMSEALQARLRELDEERAKVAAILNGMVEGVIAVDARDRVVFVNPSAAGIFRAARERVEGQPFLEVIRNKELYDLIQECRAHDSGGPIRRELTLYAPVDRVLEVHAVAFRVREEGPGVLLAIHDITELRRLERVRTEFVANVSHELKTPLTAIRGYLETLTSGALEEPENAQRFLEISLKHAERLGRLLDDLLDLSNIELGRVALSPESIALDGIIAEVLAIVRPRAQEKGISITSTVPFDFPFVVADHDRLIQILINLLDNAVKFTSSRGEVSVTATLEGSHVAVSVRDTGAGIPSTDLPRITERFYRVDRARSRELGGTGLGLAIVKHLVQVHGGELTIESELGKGTTVRFSLPIAQTLS